MVRVVAHQCEAVSAGMNTSSSQASAWLSTVQVAIGPAPGPGHVVSCLGLLRLPDGRAARPPGGFLASYELSLAHSCHLYTLYLACQGEAYTFYVLTVHHALSALRSLVQVRGFEVLVQYGALLKVW